MTNMRCTHLKWSKERMSVMKRTMTCFILTAIMMTRLRKEKRRVNQSQLNRQCSANTVTEKQWMYQRKEKLQMLQCHQNC